MEATEGTGVEGSQRLMETLLREATKARNPQNELLNEHVTNTQQHHTTQPPKSNQTLKPCMASANDEVKGMPSETAREAKVMN